VQALDPNETADLADDLDDLLASADMRASGGRV
jgi:hypothetical protein